MKKASELPVAVNNLRKIWDKKKAELKFTQVEAANELGWSQGAISHYLNDITSLNPAATIKFANFLDVDPQEIDPEILEYLPNTSTREIKYNIGNMKKPINEKVYQRTVKNSFWVEIQSTDFEHFPEDQVFNGRAQVLVCPVKEHPDATLTLVEHINKKRARIYPTKVKPPKSKINREWSVLECSVSYSLR